MDILNAGRNLSSSDAYISALHTELSKPAYQQALRILWGNYCISESEQSTSQTAGDNVLHLALRSFNSAFSGLTDTLKAFRYVTTDISPILGISCFEEGLFLDFLLFSIDQVQQLLSIDQWEPVVSGHAAYKAMLDGSATAEIMHDRFFIENTNKITGRTEKIIKYLKADQIHLEYFYTEMGDQLPTLRRSDATPTELYRFSTMGRPFPYTDHPTELLRNFYFREKYWGVNLAALLYSLKNLKSKDIPKQNQQCYYEIIEDLASEHPHTITSLMRISSPIYRFTFLRTAINEYLNGPTSGSLASLSLTEFMDKCFLPPLAKSYLEEKGIRFSQNTLPNLLSLSFWLMFVSWMDIYLLHHKLNGTVPSVAQLRQMIFDKNLLSKLSNDLCELAWQQLSTLSGIPFDTERSNVFSRWPLLLISNSANTKVIEDLLSWRTGTGRGSRGNSAKQYVSIQAKCCRSYYNTHI